MSRATLTVPMQMQGDDNNCGLCCLRTAALHFGLAGELDPAWCQQAETGGGIGRRAICAIAAHMGLQARRARARPFRDLVPGDDCLWLVRMRCALPYEKARGGVWRGVHYVLVLRTDPYGVEIGDPYPWPDREAIRREPMEAFMSAWSRADRWAAELRRSPSP